MSSPSTQEEIDSPSSNEKRFLTDDEKDDIALLFRRCLLDLVRVPVTEGVDLIHRPIVSLQSSITVSGVPQPLIFNFSTLVGRSVFPSPEPSPPIPPPPPPPSFPTTPFQNPVRVNRPPAAPRKRRIYAPSPPSSAHAASSRRTRPNPTSTSSSASSRTRRQLIQFDSPSWISTRRRLDETPLPDNSCPNLFRSALDIHQENCQNVSLSDGMRRTLVSSTPQDKAHCNCLICLRQRKKEHFMKCQLCSTEVCIRCATHPGMKQVCPFCRHENPQWRKRKAPVFVDLLSDDEEDDGLDFEPCQLEEDEVLDEDTEDEEVTIHRPPSPTQEARDEIPDIGGF